jgi:hypothetical protein
MKIIIELDSSYEQQPEIKKGFSAPADQQVNTNLAFFNSASPVDAGHARIPDGYGNDSTIIASTQLQQGNISATAGGAIDAGSSRVQEERMAATAMPDLGDTETFNKANPFSAGAFASTGSN